MSIICQHVNRLELRKLLLILCCCDNVTSVSKSPFTLLVIPIVLIFIWTCMSEIKSRPYVKTPNTTRTTAKHC